MEDVSYTRAWLIIGMLLLSKVIDALDASRMFIFLSLVTEGSFLSSILLIFLRHFILGGMALTLDLAFAGSCRGADEKDYRSTAKRDNSWTF